MKLSAALLVIVAALLAACTTQARPPLEPTPARIWMPPFKPRAAILAVHGFNDHKEAFSAFGQFAAREGVLVRSFDLPGFGARPERGLWVGRDAMTEALRAELALLEAGLDRSAPAPVFLLGESMGAAMAILAATRPGGPEIAGLILVSPAVWGRETLNPLYRSVLALADALAPGMRLTGRGLDILASDNIDMLIALGRDPLYVRATRIDAIAGLVDTMDAALERVDAIDLPMLVLLGEKDEVVPEHAFDGFFARLRNPDCTRVSYPEGWHLLLRDLGAPTVWRDMLAWIGAEDLPSRLAGPCVQPTS